MPETVQCIHLHGPSLCCMQHHTPHTWWVHLTSDQKGQMAVGVPHAHLQRVITASSQPPPAESMSPRLQNSGTTSSFSFPTSTSETSLSSIVRAVPRHRVHLNSGSGRKGPLMPLQGEKKEKKKIKTIFFFLKWPKFTSEESVNQEITSKFSEFSSPAFEICFEGYYL